MATPAGEGEVSWSGVAAGGGGDESGLTGDVSSSTGSPGSDGCSGNCSPDGTLVAAPLGTTASSTGSSGSERRSANRSPKRVPEQPAHQKPTSPTTSPRRAEGWIMGPRGWRPAAPGWFGGPWWSRQPAFRWLSWWWLPLSRSLPRPPLWSWRPASWRLSRPPCPRLWLQPWPPAGRRPPPGSRLRPSCPPAESN